MKAIALFILLLIPINIFARGSTLEVRAAYYTPTAKDIRHTYSHDWIDYQVIGTTRISKCWEAWGEVDWTIKKGHSNKGYFGFKDSTRAWILPISAGLRFIYPLSCRIQAYAGAGITYSFLKIDNRCEDYYYSFFSSSPYKKHIRKSTLGGVAKVGLIIDTYSNTFIDIFADYTYQRFHLGNHDIFQEEVFGKHFNASGFKFGAGFGVRF